MRTAVNLRNVAPNGGASQSSQLATDATSIDSSGATNVSAKSAALAESCDRKKDKNWKEGWSAQRFSGP